jgi:N-acetyltransferase 10
MGYGTRAITALNEFYSGELLNLNEVAAEMEVETFEDVAKTEKVSLYFDFPCFTTVD